MKNWQFWTLLSVILLIGFICIYLLVNIDENVNQTEITTVDIIRDTYNIKDRLETVQDIVSDMSIQILG